MDRFRFNENQSGVISGTILDQDGAPVPLASITDAVLTLYDWETCTGAGSPVAAIINGRHAQDVKNANNVVIHATTGVFTWSVQALDNPIVTERRQIERHRALLVVTATVPTIPYECEIEVINLRLSAS